MGFKSNRTEEIYCIFHQTEPCDCQAQVSANACRHSKSFSLFYNDLARWLFITLAFTGILSTGWFGIPLVPSYFLRNEIDILSSIFTLFSALGTIWGVMAYREFTLSAKLINNARDLARKLDPMIGDYQYRSYNPETKDYEIGYVPMGPIDFWDRETQVPDWLDRGDIGIFCLDFRLLIGKSYCKLYRIAPCHSYRILEMLRSPLRNSHLHNPHLKIGLRKKSIAIG